MVRVESEISKLRNTSQNYENYIPMLRPINAISARIFGRDTTYMSKIGKRRVGYHKALLENLRAEVATGTYKPCIQGNVLKDPESKGLTEGELLSVSLSMMAGADTSQPTVGWAILLLSQRQDIQRKVFDAIVQTDISLLDASDVSQSKVEYLDAFTKEVGRCFTALKLGLPRATSDDLGATWNGATIPPKTLVFLNAWACSQGMMRRASIYHQ
jgi:cytochrome P450